MVWDSQESRNSALDSLTTERPIYHHVKELPTLDPVAIGNFVDTLDDHFSGVDIISEEHFDTGLGLFEETRLLLVERTPPKLGYGLYTVYWEPAARMMSDYHGLFVRRSNIARNAKVRRVGDVAYPLASVCTVAELDPTLATEYYAGVVHYIHQLLKKNPPESSVWGADIRNPKCNVGYMHDLLERVDVDLDPSQFRVILENPEEAIKYLPYAPYRLVTATTGKVYGPKDDSVDAWFEYAKMCKALIENSVHVSSHMAYISYKEE